MNAVHTNGFWLVALTYGLYSSIVVNALNSFQGKYQEDTNSNNQVSPLLEKQELFQVTNYHYNASMGLSLAKAFIRDEALQVESQGNDTDAHCKRWMPALFAVRLMGQ